MKRDECIHRYYTGFILKIQSSTEYDSQILSEKKQKKVFGNNGEKKEYLLTEGNLQQIQEQCSAVGLGKERERGGKMWETAEGEKMEPGQTYTVIFVQSDELTVLLEEQVSKIQLVIK